MRRAVPVLAAALAAFMLAGCVRLLPESVPLDYYRIAPRAAPAAPGVDDFTRPTLMVGQPAAARAAGGDQIVIVREDGVLAHAAGVRWTAPARTMVHTYLIQTFEARPTGPAPLRPGDGISGDYDLALDLRSFEAVYDNGMESPPAVHVSVGVRLISGARNLIGSSVFAAEQRASSNRMVSIVEAFDDATNDVSERLAAWASDIIAANEARADNP